MGNFFRFFFGTPVRFLVTLGVVAAMATFSKLYPGVINDALGQLLRELNPLLTFGITIGIIALLIRVATRGKGEKK